MKGNNQLSIEPKSEVCTHPRDELSARSFSRHSTGPGNTHVSTQTTGRCRAAAALRLGVEEEKGCKPGAGELRLRAASGK
jgi:hypothetical protein